MYFSIEGLRLDLFPQMCEAMGNLAALVNLGINAVSYEDFAGKQYSQKVLDPQ